MAVINLASRYASAVQERFSAESFTDSLFSKELDMEFHGVKSVTVYDVGTADINDYARTGSNRYGTPEDLGDNLQEFTMEQDKASTWTIDKGNARQQFNIKQGSSSLKRQLREKYAPLIDRYRLRVWAEGAGKHAPVSAPTKATIVSLMLDANIYLDNRLVPDSGRVFLLPASYYKDVLLSDEFSKADALLVKAIGKGTVGEIAGVPVKKLPDSYFPAGVYFLEVFKGAAISPVQLKDYNINTAPQGVSGVLVEMRMIFDAFVRGTKADGIYAAIDPGCAVEAPAVSFAANTATMTSATAGASIRYTVDGSDPRYSKSAETYDSAGKPVVAADATVRAYAFKAGAFSSDVTDAVNS